MASGKPFQCGNLEWCSTPSHVSPCPYSPNWVGLVWAPGLEVLSRSFYILNVLGSPLQRSRCVMACCSLLWKVNAALKVSLVHGVAHLHGACYYLLNPGEATVLRRPHLWSDTNVRVDSQLLDSWFSVSGSSSCLSRSLGCCCHFPKERKMAHRIVRGTKQEKCPHGMWSHPAWEKNNRSHWS